MQADEEPREQRRCLNLIGTEGTDTKARLVTPPE